MDTPYLTHKSAPDCLGVKYWAVSHYWLEVTVLGAVSLNIKLSTRALMINETAYKLRL